tara:strand:- start:200 stop:529 length:330 start_codon:yes stop_codon:yes gene_type:complete
MEFTYKISNIKVYSTNSEIDIIKEATLHIIGTEGDQTYENFLPLELAEPSGSFTEFSNVTESQVQEWLKGTLGEEQLAANKEGLESMVNNSMFSNTATRDNPELKELVT